MLLGSAHIKAASKHDGEMNPGLIMLMNLKVGPFYIEKNGFFYSC